MMLAQGESRGTGIGSRRTVEVAAPTTMKTMRAGEASALDPAEELENGRIAGRSILVF
ncbi:MAG: hypothetical protein GY929_15095 [Actinomycetia bacterium]|nr:hypothetical protein [Actinomycetes bacterium]